MQVATPATAAAGASTAEMSFSSFAANPKAISVPPLPLAIVAAAAARRRKAKRCCCGLALSSGVQTISVFNIVIFGLAALSRLYDDEPEKMVAGLAGIFVNVVLLCGVKESRPNFLLFWLAVNAVGVLASAAYFIYLVVIYATEGASDAAEERGEPQEEADDDYERAVVSQSEILTYMFVGFLFVAIVIMLYFWFVVLSLYFEIRDARRRGEKSLTGVEYVTRML